MFEEYWDSINGYGKPEEDENDKGENNECPYCGNPLTKDGKELQGHGLCGIA